MKKRWFIYIIIGVLFGVFDVYYQEFTIGIVRIHHTYVMWLLVTWVIWLVLAVPIIVYEAKVSKSRVMSALANVLTWSVSIISYYLYIPIKLMFIGQSTMKEMYISNYRDPFYWSNISSLFLDDALGGIVRWIGVAVVGGFIVGFLISFIYLRFKKNCNVKID